MAIGAVDAIVLNMVPVIELDRLIHRIELSAPPSRSHDDHWSSNHAYDADQIGISKLRIETLAWDAAGWPSAPSQAFAMAR